ncbi:MAG: aldo/keto reductase [bacterium]|nr:aldo/keto reductase [Bacillota bacterium]HHW55548.1 aldo/keto reductase [Bacillota bacterium]
MELRPLGDTGIMVSRLCFGSLSLSPLQGDLACEEGGELLLQAFELGINFIDTAEFYDNYSRIRWALDRWSGEVVVATKSYAYSAEGMAASLEKARQALNRDVIDLFLLHEQESRLTLKGHWPALEYLLTAKARGKVRAVGVSTHTVEVTAAAAAMPEIDVIHPIINCRGLGVIDGGKEEMEAAAKTAYERGKGIYAMKPLGGGNLLREREEAFRYILNFPWTHSVAVGMQTPQEIEYNVALFSGKGISPQLAEAVDRAERRLHIAEWCEGCGICAQHCNQKALVLKGGRMEVIPENCILCGYCGGYCPQFCIKIY